MTDSAAAQTSSTAAPATPTPSAVGASTAGGSISKPSADFGGPQRGPQKRAPEFGADDVAADSEPVPTFDDVDWKKAQVATQIFAGLCGQEGVHTSMSRAAKHAVEGADELLSALVAADKKAAATKKSS
jgi:hypothetical protein